MRKLHIQSFSTRINSYFRMNLLTSARFYFHTTEWTGYVLIGFGGIFFIVIASLVFRMVELKNETHEIQCLATNIYHEARGEPLAGQYAVAIVTMNRVKSKNHPDDVCKVVYLQKWSVKRQRYIAAFSWTTESHNRKIEPDAWHDAIKIAKQTYNAEVQSKVKDALFYHADYVTPYWSHNKVKITKIGRHIFYK